MDNRRVGDRVDLNKVVEEESYMYLSPDRTFVPLKVRSIRPSLNYVVYHFIFNKDEAPPFFSNFVVLNPRGQSPFFVDLKEMGRNVRNAKLFGAITGLAHGPESLIARHLTGLPGNAYQQENELKRKAGIQGADPKTTQYSGRKTRRRTRSKRTRSKKYKRST